jgi:hypothetical protein
VNLHHVDADPNADPDSTYRPEADPDANPDSNFLFDDDPDPTFHPDADPDPCFKEKAQTLLKSTNIGSCVSRSGCGSGSSL